VVSYVKVRTATEWMQLKHIITLLLKFLNNHEVQVRSPVSRYLYRRYTKNLLNRYRSTIHSWCAKSVPISIPKYRRYKYLDTAHLCRWGAKGTETPPPLSQVKVEKKYKKFFADFVHATQSNVTARLSYPPSYLILSHSSSWRSYFCKNIGYF